jgi:hypothetical protein
MSINFPDSPSPGQVYTFGSRSWTWNGYAWSAVANTNIVTSFNGLTGAVEGVSSVNGQTGAVTITSLSGGVTGIVGGTGIFVSGQTGNVTITNIGVLSVNGQTGNVTITVSSSDGVTGIVGGTGIAVSGQTGNVTIANIGVLSVNGATGAITNVAKTNVAQTFTQLQDFSAGISASYLETSTNGYVIADVLQGKSNDDIVINGTPDQFSGLYTKGTQFEEITTVWAGGNYSVDSITSAKINLTNSDTNNKTQINLKVINYDGNNDIGVTAASIVLSNPHAQDNLVNGKIELYSTDTTTIESANGSINLTSYTGGINLTQNSSGNIVLQQNSTGEIQLNGIGGPIKIFNAATSASDHGKILIGDVVGASDGLFVAINDSPYQEAFYVKTWLSGVTMLSIRQDTASSLYPTGLPEEIYLNSNAGNIKFYGAGLIVNSGATFTGNIYAPNIVTSVNGITGPVGIAAGSNISISSSGKTLTISGNTASVMTIGSSNVNATRYLTFVGGSGATGIFIDDVTTPLTYNPQGGNIGAKKVTLTTSSNVITLDSASPNILLTDGSNSSTFGLDSFAAAYAGPFTISNSNGLTLFADSGIAMEGTAYSYVFPQSNGSNGQVLTTNGAGILSWSTVSGSGSATGFTYASSAPGSPSIGDRWIDSDTGKEYVYINDGSSSQWIEPVSSNGLVGVTYTPSIRLLEFGVTGSFVKLGVNNTSPQYTLDVNGIINTPVGISAGPINASGATFSGAVVSDGGYRITSSTINAQSGTTYTLLTSDNGKIITMNNGSTITLTVPTGLPIGFNTTVIQLGSGQVGITAASTTLNSFEGKLKLAGQHAAASIISYTTNVFNVAGGLTG